MVFANECGSRISPTSPLRDLSHSTALTAVSQGSDSTVISPYTVSDDERTSYYSGITDGGEHPDLLYRTGSDKYPWTQPTGRFAYRPTKSVRGVYGTPLNNVWSTVGPQIYEVVKNAVKTRFSIDPARFVTHGQDGEDTLGPVVIWVTVFPASTSPDIAHEVSQVILTLLNQNGVENAEVEWQEAVTSRLIGPRPLRPVGTDHATVHVRRHLTATLGIPLAAVEMGEVDDAQGTLGFCFHENRDKHGNPSTRVLGVSNHHVLRKTVDEMYEFKGAGTRPQYVRVCGLRTFQRDLDDIKVIVSRHLSQADLHAREIIKLEENGMSKDEEEAEDDAEQLRKTRQKLDEEKAAVDAVEKFYKTLTGQWSDIANRNIGHVHYSPPISVDVKGERYTEDWGTFELSEEKFKDQFKGNVVDFGPFDSAFSYLPYLIKKYLFQGQGFRLTD